MRLILVRASLALLIVLCLPLAGVIISGTPISSYLEFPPRTQYVDHAPFSWFAFALCLLVILGVLFPFLRQVWRTQESVSLPDSENPRRRFAWWGLLGFSFTALFWLLAWSRFDWFSIFQPHTFAPLWLGYIVTINAVTEHRAGTCLLKKHPIRFLLLFPLSAGFWWVFEWLNRFVQNWTYQTPTVYSAGEYFLYASISFSTVLPAVASTAEMLQSFPAISQRFSRSWPFALESYRTLTIALFSLAASSLLLIGILPNFLFPLLWVSPLIILICLQLLLEGTSLFPELSRGDWSRLISWSLAALVCGFFWELWNYYSLAKWTYNIPYVEQFKIFEMPILGYAGYLPFGLECAAVVTWVVPHEDP